MKPTKNRYYCHACGKPKMLFKTEAEAKTFLRFNSDGFDEPSEKVPIRSYYCSLCSGWHVTSQPERTGYDHYKSVAESVVESSLRLAEQAKIPHWQIEFTDKLKTMPYKEGEALCRHLAYVYNDYMFYIRKAISLTENAICEQLASDTLDREVCRAISQSVRGLHKACRRLRMDVSELTHVDELRASLLDRIQRLANSRSLVPQ